MRFGAMTQVQRSFSTELPPLVPVQLPSRMEAHLWYVLPDEVKSESLLRQYSELLSPCEKDNVLQMRGDDLKKKALLARALVRTTISRYLVNNEVDPRSLKFKKNIYGKPEVDWQDDEKCANNPSLHFNLSHTSSLIACGVTVNVPIGIDVEDKRRSITHDVLAFARRYFSSDEVNFLSSLPDAEVQREEFIKLWILKEAYVKALGRGFSASPFNTFTIRSRTEMNGGYGLSKASEITLKLPDDAEKCNNEWKFALLELAGYHFAAICVGEDKTSGGAPLKVIVRKTIPFVEDEHVTELELP
ncbi:PREDICTED: uncharacterized protein LOC104816589 isoform X2 [Tarenaya hassleriana]|uniref:uncharacterized protein LOC104816589 isoform X2 n=1 Tax=Tarenaya hassleriana TaxID=28532 RepID=UPI00053C2C13|nr:PREDICTED: uncharacterized protein LOC104816589 isoform X2 [Tarenaya hassleriana]